MPNHYTQEQLSNIWHDFEKNRLIVEKKMFKYLYNHYLKTFIDINEQLLLGRKIIQSLYFNQKWVNEMYSNLYKIGGLRFANWYANTHKEFIIKEQTEGSLNLPVSVYNQIFEEYSRQVAALFGSQIVAHATQNAIRVFENLMKGNVKGFEEFSSYGIDKKARILMQQTKAQCKIFAKRVALTEGTRIANYSIHKTALTFFSQDDLIKTWISAQDSNVRPTHGEAHSRYSSNPIPSKENFIVGGDSMQRPGAGVSAKETVNCRCVSWEYPRPGAETIADIDDFGFGIGSGGFIN